MAGQNEGFQKTRKKRRHGLRFLLFLIILLGILGTAFFFMWVEFRLDEGEYGVVFTKTRGYGKTVLKGGTTPPWRWEELAWRWQALIPTNLTLHVFSLEKRGITDSREGMLPSGDVYAAETGTDFSWKIATETTYRLDPESLTALVADGLPNGGLDAWYADYEARLTNEISRMMGDTLTETDPRAVERELYNRLAAVDARVELLDVTVRELTLPDPVLYNETRELYLQLLRTRESVMAELEIAALRREDAQDTRLGLLEKYGKILSDYPVLIEFFALETNPASILLPPINEGGEF